MQAKSENKCRCASLNTSTYIYFNFDTHIYYIQGCDRHSLCSSCFFLLRSVSRIFCSYSALLPRKQGVTSVVLGQWCWYRNDNESGTRRETRCFHVKLSAWVPHCCGGWALLQLADKCAERIAKYHTIGVESILRWTSWHFGEKNS